MPKFLRRLLFILLILLIVLVGGGILALSAFEEPIGNQIVNTVNKQLTTPLKVVSFDLSMLRSFPKVSAALEDVELRDERGTILLQAQEVSFRLSLFSLFSRKISLSQVVVRNGTLNLLITEDGRRNFDILKSSGEETESSNGSSVGLKLTEARLQRMDLIYNNKPLDQRIGCSVNDALFTGEFSAEAFKLNSQADFFSSAVELDGQRYLVDKDIQYDAILDINLAEGTYTFDKFDLTVEDNLFTMDGFIRNRETINDINLSIQSEESNLQAVLQLLPKEFFDVLGGLSSDGKFFFKADFNGVYDANSYPGITVNFGLEKGRLSSGELKNALRDVSFQASFTNGAARNNRQSVFELKNFRGFFDKKAIEMDLLLRNFDDPYIDFNMEGIISLNELDRLLEVDFIRDGDGDVEVQNLSVSGRYYDMLNANTVSRVNASADIDLDDITIKVQDERLSIDKGNFQLQGNTLTIRDFELEGAGSEMYLNGSLSNLLPVLLADSTNSRNAKLIFTGDLQTETLDLDRLLSLADMPGEAAASDPMDTVQEAAGPSFSSFLDGTFEARVENFNYDKIEGSDFVGKLIAQDNKLYIEGNTNAMEGSFDLTGTLFLQDSLRIEAKLDCQSIDAKEFFRQTNSFGQSVLTDRHLDGTLNSKMTIFAKFDPQGNFLPDELLVFAGLGISDGRLQDFEMLENFSSYISLDRLNDIRFANLQNWLMIRNSQIYLPAMFIQTTALNLTVSGTHTFDNAFKYFLKVNLEQALGQKIKGKNKDMELVKAKKSGFINLYFKIFGDLDNYEYEQAKKDAKDAFDRSEILKRDIRRALMQAFGQMDLLEEPEEWMDE